MFTGAMLYHGHDGHGHEDTATVAATATTTVASAHFPQKLVRKQHE